MLRVSIVILLLSAMAESPAWADGDPIAGQALAKQSCAGCHDIRPNASPVWTDGAPSFRSVAEHPAITDLALHVFLQTPHAKMPNLRLVPAELDDLSSYILSLRGGAKRQEY
ncbi:MAG TPA: c-type cytochrome [Aliidongia sp.]|nr:c-type cytochrome [Aliidongia sp.]